MIIFGLGGFIPTDMWTVGANMPPSAIALLEFQIPPYTSRYASFLFSFLGRGICRQSLYRNVHPMSILTNPLSLHLCWIDPNSRPYFTGHCWCHYHCYRSHLHCVGIHPIDRAAAEHERGRCWVGCRAGLEPELWDEILVMRAFHLRGSHQIRW